jgi:hypothetical protein
MKKLNSKLFLIITLAVVFPACKKSSSGINSLYTPTASDVTSTATLDELKSGRALYINNCNSCHDLYSPDDFSASQWKSNMMSMGPKTHMTSSENILVTKYLSRGK